MRRIPTLFKTENGLDSGPATRLYSFDTSWVLRGHGIPTYKWTGIAVRHFSGVWYHRDTIEGVTLDEYREFMRSPSLGDESKFPFHFKLSQYDYDTHQAHGWTPAFGSSIEPALIEAIRRHQLDIPSEGTYELVGPELSGNPHELSSHELRSHSVTIKEEVPTDYEGLKIFLGLLQDAEGVVWHSVNSKKAKVKKSNFGIEWDRE